MTDRIVLTNMRFEARHGVHDWERETAQPFEVDVELRLDLRPRAAPTTSPQTVDYGRVYDEVAARGRRTVAEPARGDRRGDRQRPARPLRRRSRRSSSASASPPSTSAARSTTRASRSAAPARLTKRVPASRSTATPVSEETGIATGDGAWSVGVTAATRS